MKIRKTICSLLLVCLAFLGIFCGRANVYADQKQALSATVTLLKQEKDCVVQVEAKNSGADFTGKVRLVFSGTDNSNGCAFEQRLTLPQNGKKQYTMTIPYADVSQTRGNGIVAFIDEKGNVVAKEAFASIFGKEKRGIGVGVLSDHYDALGWMSMSGQTYYLHGKDQNVYLTQMDADTLQAQLDELYFLVIDSYDVSSLGKENIKAIEKWVKNGGWLLIGTGERGKDTLGGFDSSFMEVSCKSVSKWEKKMRYRKKCSNWEVIPDLPGLIFHRCRLQSCSGTIQMQAKAKLIRGGCMPVGMVPSVYVPFLLAKNRCRKFPRICVTEFMTRWQDIP